VSGTRLRQFELSISSCYTVLDIKQKILEIAPFCCRLEECTLIRDMQIVEDNGNAAHQADATLFLVIKKRQSLRTPVPSAATESEQLPRIVVPSAAKKSVQPPRTAALPDAQKSVQPTCAMQDYARALRFDALIRSFEVDAPTAGEASAHSPRRTAVPSAIKECVLLPRIAAHSAAKENVQPSGATSPFDVKNRRQPECTERVNN
jgi:hypothetical protein